MSCVICLEGKIEFYYPCGHACVCGRCNRVLVEMNNGCPMCRHSGRSRRILFPNSLSEEQLLSIMNERNALIESKLAEKQRLLTNAKLQAGKLKPVSLSRAEARQQALEANAEFLKKVSLYYKPEDRDFRMFLTQEEPYYEQAKLESLEGDVLAVTFYRGVNFWVSSIHTGVFIRTRSGFKIGDRPIKDDPPGYQTFYWIKRS